MPSNDLNRSSDNRHEMSSRLTPEQRAICALLLLSIVAFPATFVLCGAVDALVSCLIHPRR